MDNLPDRIDSKFRFVLIAANRAEQLMRGARPKVDVAPNEKLTTVATDEVMHDLVEWEAGPAPRVEIEMTEDVLEEIALGDDDDDDEDEE
jgi:DNA-directed RNA polymerase omega subunit